MTRVYIIRHAEAEGNLYRRSQGWYDGRITPRGMLQIAALERRFADISIDAVYSSDLRRTQTTAQAVTRPKGLELRLDPGLREIGMGIYEDIPFGQLLYRCPERMQLFFRCSPQWSCQNGETFQQVCGRMTAALRRIIAAHPDQTVAVFSHGAAIRCLQSALRGKHPSETPELGNGENTAVTCLEAQGEAINILFENDASHLPPQLATQAAQRLAGQAPRPRLETWFRPLDLSGEDERLYLKARQAAWEDLHGCLDGFDGPGLLSEARGQWALDHRAAQLVMARDQSAGILELPTLRQAEEGAGWISFLYLFPEFRSRSMGVQLVGQAVSVYRAMGRKKLCLRCAPDNLPAQKLYERCGFRKTGSEPGARGALDVLEMEL